MMAPTATSALPSSESRLANITGETLTREEGTPAIVTASAFFHKP